MKIKFFNVSSFLITTESGVRIITDPYQHNYKPVDPPPDWVEDRPGVAEVADVVAISHPHADHSYMWAVKGTPQVYTGGASIEIRGVKFSGMTTLHDNYGEAEGLLSTRGPNGIIGIEADGIRIWHLGDYGMQKFTDEQLARIGRVDILMMPWDMPNELQEEIFSQLTPRVVFPMHHIRVDEFMTGRKGFIDHRVDNVSELTFEAATLPQEMQIILLKPALDY